MTGWVTAGRVIAAPGPAHEAQTRFGRSRQPDSTYDIERFEEGIKMFRRIQEWFFILFFLAPWLLLPMMPVMAATLWAFGIG